MRKLMPLQAFGTGDVIFTQSLVRYFQREGYEIIWPVQPKFVDWYSFAYPSMTFIPDTFIRPEIFDIKKESVVDGIKILPIRWAESILGREYKYHMVSKYDLFGLDWRIWKDHAYPVRNYPKEAQLMKLHGVEEGERYNFIHTRFGNQGQYVLPIKVNNDLKNVEMKFVDGYSLFDYCSLYENAENIHAVSSGSLYLFEVLNLQCKELHLYNRTPIEKNLDYVRFLLTKNYILHE